MRWDDCQRLQGIAQGVINKLKDGQLHRWKYRKIIENCVWIEWMHEVDIKEWRVTHMHTEIETEGKNMKSKSEGKELRGNEQRYQTRTQHLRTACKKSMIHWGLTKDEIKK